VKYDFGLDAISELTLSQSLFFLGESALTFWLMDSAILILP
jgi:hypothetical protein